MYTIRYITIVFLFVFRHKTETSKSNEHKKEHWTVVNGNMRNFFPLQKSSFQAFSSISSMTVYVTKNMKRAKEKIFILHSSGWRSTRPNPIFSLAKLSTNRCATIVCVQVWSAEMDWVIFHHSQTLFQPSWCNWNVTFFRRYYHRRSRQCRRHRLSLLLVYISTNFRIPSINVWFALLCMEMFLL